jgi:hypothetical protein
MSENSIKPSQIRIRTPLQPETNPMNERWEQKWIGTHRIDQISYYLLVGGIPTPLKNMSLSAGMIIPNIWEIIKFMFQSPPTS